MYGGEEVVLAVGEHVVVEGDAWGDKLGDAALDEFLGELRVLELLADGHALARAHELGEVGVEGVMGKSGELDVLGRAVGAACEGDAEDLGCGDGVVGERLVEVAHAEEQHGVGMLLFHLEILLHQGRLHNFLCHRACV